MTHPYEKNAAAARRLVFTTILILSGLAQLPGQLSGTYTIGGTLPNYPTISKAVSVLNAVGVAGPVTFIIRPGYYNERVTLRNVRGASRTNTITFRSLRGNSNDVSISPYAYSGNEGFTLKFDNARHYRIIGLTIRSWNEEYGGAIKVVNGAYDLRIEGCDVVTPEKESFNPEEAAIFIEPLWSSTLEFRSNLIHGGAYGIYYAGSQNTYSRNTKIIGNRITGYFLTGLYASDLQGGELTGNTIFGGYNGYTNSKAVNIRSWNGTSISPVLMANNFVTITRGSYRAVGISNSQYLQIFHNSLNQPNSLTLLELTDVSNSAVLNNVLRVGTGLAALIQGATNLTMDYNDLYGEGTYLARLGNKAAANLITWRYYTGLDQHSISVDPQFVSDYNLHAKASALINAGVAVPSVGVDIDGESRSNPPCIGADEFKLAIKFPWWYPMYSAKSMEPGTAATGNDADAKQEGIGISVREHAVFPTPAFDRLNIAITDGYTGSVTLSVLDGLGRKVSEVSYEKDGPDLRTEITVSDLVPGVYLLRIEEGKEVTVKRFVKR